MDAFFETLVKHRKTPKDALIEVGIFFGSLFLALFVFYLTHLMQLHAIGAVGAATILFFAVRAVVFHTWEYEYIFTEGVVDIDKVIAQRKRQREISFDCRDCEIIAPLNGGTHFDAFRHLPMRDYTAYPAHPDNYFAVLERGGARICVLFQPTEDMVHAFRRYNPAGTVIE